MKKFIMLLFTALLCSAGFAQIKMPPASPAVTVIQEVGISEITLKYSRPSMRERKIFGGLVPYGKVWRTGANTTTTLAIKEDITLEGNEVPAGTYSIYTIPNKEEWTIILNKRVMWGTQYDESQDFLRFTVKPEVSAQVYETFTIDFGSFTTNSALLSMKWESTVVNLKIGMEVDAQVSAQIDRFMKDPTRSLAGTYYQSASYYFRTEKDLNKALEWVNKSLEYNPNPYWVLRLKSQILAGMNKYEDAIATAEKSKKKAEEAGNKDYMRLNDEAISEWKEML